jgi:hypothetical protein
MTTLTIFLAGFCLATFAWGVFCVLILLHRPRYTAPTRRRKNRDAPGRVACGQLMDEEQAAFARKLEVGYQPIRDADFAEVGGIDPLYMYGVTGEER